ncbi:MAG: transcription repressor NadR [Eubacteriales bacterium]|nr:transcription repressor NadR [Eubacteriales bacterium]MDD3349233.1 transcription repressor NadR [Eubacteriales bacterium]
MNGEKRREEIIAMLAESTTPLSGSELALAFHVSRQVIVQDIALLKASHHKILSTYKGYVLQEAKARQRVFRVKHKPEEIADELYTIVDAGGRIIDVFVFHEIYGELRAKLSLRSRLDVDEFVKELALGEISPLMHLTDGTHSHTVEAESEEILECIKDNLKAKKFLAQE